MVYIQSLLWGIAHATKALRIPLAIIICIIHTSSIELAINTFAKYFQNFLQILTRFNLKILHFLVVGIPPDPLGCSCPGCFAVTSTTAPLI